MRLLILQINDSYAYYLEVGYIVNFENNPKLKVMYLICVSQFEFKSIISKINIKI